MRSIGGLILGLGLGIFLTGSAVTAQDAPKPIAIQVVIGADGSVKVIDAKTGKEIDDAVIKLLAKPGAVEVQNLDKKKIEDLRKAIDKAIEAEFKDPKPAPKAKAKPLQIEFDLQLEPLRGIKLDKEEFEKLRASLEKLKQDLDNREGLTRSEQQARIALARVLQKLKEEQAQAKPQPAASLDKKLDLILKQLEDLRKDVDGIKKKLDGKRPNDIRLWQVVPTDKNKKPGVIEIELVPANPKDAKPGGPRFEYKLVPTPGADKSRANDPAIQKALEFLRKQQAEQALPAQPNEPKRMDKQDGRPAVQITIGADGTVRVFDGKTGRELVRVNGPKPGTPMLIHPPQYQKLDPGVRKQLDLLLKEAAEGEKQINDLIKKLEAKTADPGKKVVVELPRRFDRNAQLERRIEVLLREVDELRRELEKTKK